MRKEYNKYQMNRNPRPSSFQNDPRRLYFQRKKERQEKIKSNIKIGIIVVLLITSIFVMIYRTNKQDEIFMTLAENKQKMQDEQKENAQLSYTLRNTMSLTAIKDEAQNNHGMRKVTPEQITKVYIDKKDFVEKVQGSTIKTNEQSLFEKIFDQIMKVL